MTTSAARLTRNRLVSASAVVVLAAINVTDHLLQPPWWVRALEGAGLLAWARLDGLSWSQLGLGRNRLGARRRGGGGAGTGWRPAAGGGSARSASSPASTSSASCCR